MAALTISENAAKRIQFLIDGEGDPELMFRVTVSGGGCSGFQYGFSLDKTTEDDDILFEQHGVRMVIDEASLEILDGSEVDYVEELIGSAFRVQNPHATSTCGCGTSFAM